MVLFLHKRIGNDDLGIGNWELGKKVISRRVGNVFLLPTDGVTYFGGGGQQKDVAHPTLLHQIFWWWWATKRRCPPYTSTSNGSHTRILREGQP
ncbi:MAG TPA: hypothetical protein ENG03_04370 [Thioploca sp.]|nr:hypothetical protein [Thioploca sp.]